MTNKKGTGFVPTGFVPFEQVFEEAAKGVDSLILVSGGLDSAYVLWEYSRVVTDRPIHAHHVKLMPSVRKRHKVEEYLVKKQVAYIDRQVHLYESIIDVDDKAKCGLMRDFFMPVLMSIQMALVHNLKYIVIGEDLMVAFLRNTGITKMSQPFEDAQVEALSHMVWAGSHGRVQLSWHTENKDFFKSYISMPPDYMKLCFSCRAPVFTRTHMEACGKCMSCHRNQMLEINDLLCKRMKWEEQ